MAGGNSESKTEEATPKRLRDARKRGQVAKSIELSGALSLLATLLCVVSMAPWAAKRIADFGVAVDRSFESLSIPTVQYMVMEAMLLTTKLSLIPLIVAVLIYGGAQWLQTGPVFSLDLVKPKLERLNPIEGARRLLSVKSLVQLVFMLCKASIIGAAAFLVCLHMLGDAIRVIHSDAGAALAVANAALVNLLLWCGGLFVLLGLLDLGYQRWQYLRDQRMSLSEVRREHKDEQGDGKLKSQRKNFAQAPIPREQLAHIRMASLLVEDDQARVVALVYRPKQYPLPLFLVRGTADFGAEILAGARHHKILTVTDSPLVAALFPAAQTGLPIPAAQLDAVLAHIQRGAT